MQILVSEINVKNAFYDLTFVNFVKKTNPTSDGSSNQKWDVRFLNHFTM